MNRYCARAPGKLILSGEHAVVYGAPAIVVAVARYTRVCFQPFHRGSSLCTALTGITRGRRLPLSALDRLRQKLDQRFEAFLAGQLSVNTILQRPDDLILYTLAQCAKHVPVVGRTKTQSPLAAGRLKTFSDLPLGAGMGSSAAAIAATMVLYEHLLNRPQTLAQRFEKVRFCERLQHGKGSAIDAAAVTFGGIQFLQEHNPCALDLSLKNWYWILSGIPECSTGECVAFVRERHKQDTALWQAFSDCTQALKSVLTSEQSPADVMKENHDLLTKIGVVPEKTRFFIEQMNRCGGAAKISGAGAVRGHHGGMILVWHPDYEALHHFLMQNYPALAWGKIEVADCGAALCDDEQ